MSKFERECRYIVIKRKDLALVPVAYRRSLVEPLGSLMSHIPHREYVVVESDWPEYETVWGMIEARVTGQPSELEQLRTEAQALREEVAALRARVVMPERLGTTTSQGLMDVMTLHHHLGWNACLDELARLNGKVVNEGLLRRALAYIETMTYGGTDGLELIAELRALLGEGKEHE